MTVPKGVNLNLVRMQAENMATQKTCQTWPAAGSNVIRVVVREGEYDVVFALMGAPLGGQTKVFFFDGEKWTTDYTVRKQVHVSAGKTLTLPAQGIAP